MKKLRIGVAALIAACMLLAAVGFAAANHWGLLDFWGNEYTQVLPEAGQLLTTAPTARTETEYATFTLREAVYDGLHVYLIVDILPQPGYRLNDPGYAPLNAVKTPAQLLAEERDANLTPVNVGASTDFGAIGSMDAHIEEDGSVVYYLDGVAPESNADSLDMAVRCMSVPEDSTDSEREVRRTTLEFTLPKAGSILSGESKEPVEFATCGVRVDKVRLDATPMGLYCKVYFTEVDPEACAIPPDELYFEFVAEDGKNSMKRGATSYGSVDATGEGTWVQWDSVGAVDQLPESVTLRVFSDWQTHQFEMIEIPIFPVG